MKKIYLIGILMASQNNGATQLEFNSLDFRNNGKIPKEFTQEGQNTKPRLVWSGAPVRTKSFVLIMDDPDASKPETPWVHWVAYDIAADKNSLDHITDRDLKMSDGTMQGINSDGNIGYDGPMPPPGHGVHHYHVKLYALNTKLKLKPGANKKQVEKAMQGHVLAHAQIVGLYERK